MANNRSQNDDLQTDANLKRIDDLEIFRKEFEGKEFDKKVLQSIKDSHPIRTELEGITWKTVKGKINYFFWGAVGLILMDLLLRAIPNLLSLISGK